MCKMKKLLCLLCMIVLIMAMTVTANAEEMELIAEVQPVPAEVPDNGGHTPPSGNMILVEDVMQITDSGSREFIVIESRNGHHFYIIIDRSKNGEQVHFLNQVDEADLVNILKEEGLEQHVKCICKEKCTDNAVNPECLICRMDHTGCLGAEKVVEPSPSPAETKTKKTFPEPDNQTYIMIGLIAGAIILVFLYKTAQSGKSSAPGRSRDDDRSDYHDRGYHDEYEDEDDYEEI